MPRDAMTFTLHRDRAEDGRLSPFILADKDGVICYVGPRFLAVVETLFDLLETPSAALAAGDALQITLQWRRANQRAATGDESDDADPQPPA